jgi:hypothetical protein
VYLFAANATGCGGGGLSASSNNASISLLNAATTGLSDSVGAYVLTNSTGGFTITGDYSCTLNQQVYLYALGGSSSSTTNSAAGLLAVLGSCPGGNSAFAAGTPFVAVNEVSTVAAAYAFAGFATDATHVSSSGTALAKTGIANAFANSANLAGISTGVALATTPAGNGTVPQSEINTLANILAACMNSSGPSFTACSTLFSNAESAGSTGTPPTDTATAAINIAHNPGSNVANLYALSTPTPPFSPALSGQPNDFTIALNFTGGGLTAPVGIAIDGSGDVWAANGGIADSVSELSSAGVAISPSTGFTGGGLDFSQAIAIDGSGNAWATNERSSAGVNSVTELSSSGTPTSGSPYTGGGLNVPAGLAIDGSGNAWAADNNANAVSKFNSGGTAQSGAGGYTGGGLGAPYDIAIDGSGDAWAINSATNSLSKLSNSGTPISSSSGYTGGGINTAFAIALDSSGDAWVTNAYGNSISKFANGGGAISPSSGYTGGGLNGPYGGIAIDGAGSVWAANYYGGLGSITGSVSEFSSSGSAISPPTGYVGGSLSGSNGVAIDGSGDVWVTEDYGNGGLTEFIGAATPVITPIAAGLPATPTANGTSNLGTRP